MIKPLLSRSLPSRVLLRRFATGPTPKQTSSKRFKLTKKRIVLGSIVGAGVVYYKINDTAHDVLRHVFLTSRRIGVVALATIRCFHYYKKTLDAKYETPEERRKALDACHQCCADITLRALQTNGGVFIKLGQHIGSMTYMLPPEWTNTMIPLQDQCPESTFEEINDMFKQDLKINIDEMFSEFDPKPIGVASLAQVHVAKLRDTDQMVAVKCQHPSLKEFVPLDVMLTQTVFNLMDIVFPEYPLLWLGDELQSSIFVELDFTKEARNAISSAELFSKSKAETALIIPKVVSANRRILVMEYIKGSRLDDLKFLDSHKISRAEVSVCLSHIFNKMIFTPNAGLHCDPHGGNLAIRPSKPSSANPHNFEIVLYDHGLYRFPTTQTRRDYAHFWLALLDHDREAMKFYAKRFAHITDDQFPLLAAAITGRSIDTALNFDISKRRSNEEIETMAAGLMHGSVLVDLMGLLARIPGVVLLILKTNDLTRHLDECLQSPLGPERTFLIMTQYCARMVYDETCELISNQYSKWSLTWLLKELKAWFEYEKRKNQLVLYDIALWWKGKPNLKT
ncbi:hypothetical protein HG536_0C02570 [Torulaspora globosa]|uniref:ABC1 atypical kinase-like domain-containing protein n=1 Tax=Torulaspora globosa TaxID=48254 RepID=A0A7G3ZF02_9SACH|nr:uncharacterized protein HG536_0C02570 [Torulaspora globosa]QLL32088.1 hypothetical protein HG536_0C02570 [Torulaspora globosa]